VSYTEKSNARRRIAVSVVQRDDGIAVFQHDTPDGPSPDIPGHVVAVFPEDGCTVTVKGEFGPELAMQDLAVIRAYVFARAWEAVVNEGKVDLGEALELD
jgi:hypothetical protein